MSNAWKAFERYICKLFGGKRRGADYADKYGGKNDCLGTPGWSIEVKSWKNPSWKAMFEDAIKAEERAKPGDIPIAVFHWKHRPRKTHTLVAMRLETFLEYFGDGRT